MLNLAALDQEIGIPLQMADLYNKLWWGTILQSIQIQPVSDQLL